MARHPQPRQLGNEQVHPSGRYRHNTVLHILQYDMGMGVVYRTRPTRVFVTALSTAH